ncbi:MAG: acyl-CoA thioesterase [Pirellulaceae bacterium]|nr:acyl-CoA thioesterase [Pirellulaceae bacterium]
MLSTASKGCSRLKWRKAVGTSIPLAEVAAQIPSAEAPQKRQPRTRLGAENITVDDSRVLADYPSVVTLPVQWGDQDAFGHVNNTVPLRWFETSRIAYLEQSGLGYMMSGAGLGPIVASITCNYRRQIVYPETVYVGTKLDTLRRSSMILAHAVYSRSENALAADGQTVVVFFDYDANRPRRVPDEVREKIEAFDKQAESL